MRKPDFIVAGGHKCASTWVMRNVGRHPEVFPIFQELNYFGRNDLSIEGYKRYMNRFRNAEDNQVAGEKSTECSYWDTAELASAHMHATLPDVKVVIILRDPVYRSWSHYRWRLYEGFIPDNDVSFEEYVEKWDPRYDPWRIVGNSWYSMVVVPYIKLFGANLKIVFYEDMVRDPGKVYESILSHIGVKDTRFRPTKLCERVRHSTRVGEMPRDLYSALYAKYYVDSTNEFWDALERSGSDWDGVRRW